jgi:hypothetical protein
MQKQKAIKRTKHIKANCISLMDSEGRTRIVMNADGKDGAAYISLFAKDGKSIQISSQPNGAIGIHIGGRKIPNLITIGLSADESGTILISDKSGKLGTVLGEEPRTSTHRLLLFKNGKHFWNTPTGKKQHRKK